jgi:ferric-dicitrate binding protein FerR (iron transport regulator)
MNQMRMKLSRYISLFHRQRTGQLRPEEEEAFRSQQDPGLHRELEAVWSESRSYKSGYEPDVDKGFSRLKFRMDADRAREAQTVQLKSTSRKWMSIAAAIALVMALGTIWLVNRGQGASGMVFTTGPAEQLEVTLPDASVVYLNEDSYLSFDVADGKRQVSLTGEAYFKVAPDPGRPFVIQSNGVRTTVLGTAFNLRAYPEEPTVEVEVTEGLVRMENAQVGQQVELKPKERGVFKADEQKLVKKPAPELNAQGWHSQQMVFRDAALGNALEEIGRYYNVEFKLANKDLQSCALSTEIEGDPLPDFLQVLETIYGLNVEQVGASTYQLNGGRCR